jgi:uncharacterized surface protein with fasciclin (FAS1) repeats
MRILVTILLIVVCLVPASAQDPALSEVVAANADLSTLFTLISTANLLETLSDSASEFTLFAPTNAAFEALSAEAAEVLLSDPALLTRVLTYHLVNGRISSADLTAMEGVTGIGTMEMPALDKEPLGSDLTVTNDDEGLRIDGASILTADLPASNGVVHIIDRVLLPVDVAVQLGIEMSEETAFALFGTLNPAGLENDAVFMTDAALTNAIVGSSAFINVASVQSVAFDSAGSMYVTVDIEIDADGRGTAGGLLIYDDIKPRRIAGEATGLISPKGLQVLETLGVVAIADNGARDVKLFAMDADGNAAPSAVISIGEEGSVWDIWYDLINDTLYTAKTNGELAAYDLFSQTMGADGPDRIIIPTDGQGEKISVNLHGIDVDYDNNTIILSDVGDAQNATDGQIFVMIAVSISDGPTPVDLRIAGDQTGLGNPVDLIYDGSGIFIAEKSNDTVLYYADILGREGDLNVAPDAMQPAVKAESVAIFPTRESAMIADMMPME